MLFLTIARHYIIWHYTRALTEYWHVAKNLLWFVVNFFSLPQLTKSIFAPFRRITEERGDRFSFEDLAGYVIIGIISRLIGFILRLTIILAGTAATISLLALIIVTYILWLVAPVALITLFVFGIKFLITPS